jgi:hypothetical protein
MAEHILNADNAARAAAEAGLPGIYLQHVGASAYPGGWTVNRPGFKTDPSRIHNGGRKLFMGAPSSPARQEAIDWATARYGITEWVKIPGFRNTLFPAAAAQTISDAYKAAKEAKERP